MGEKVGTFYTTKGFRYHGKLTAETETHYVVFDVKSNREVELLKATVETVLWE